MTITLTKEELQQFQANLAGWYAQRTIYVFEKIDFHAIQLTRDLAGMVSRLQLEFEKQNAKPDWRTLL